jgi:hypothetical protein
MDQLRPTWKQLIDTRQLTVRVGDASTLPCTHGTGTVPAMTMPLCGSHPNGYEIHMNHVNRECDRHGAQQ